MSHASVAARVRAEKDAHPDRFCLEARCLWRVSTRAGYRPCPRHSRTPSVGVLARARALAQTLDRDQLRIWSTIFRAEGNHAAAELFALAAEQGGDHAA